MRQCHKNIALIALLLSGLAFSAFAQEEEGKGEKVMDMDTAAEKEAERLGEVLKLEDWQIFYTDSILRHDYGAMQREVQQLQATGVSRRDLFLDVQDKWMEKADAALEKLFTPAQWKKYLRDGAGRRIKEREKRKKDRQ